ncbi:glycosyltransferase family 4 protein [Burkholderia multivorans]|uniref:glycosyltransferase family 4 protein n=1 Tax=Burkholderia multivorans TaxID=87883 RepID=UPI000D001D31|nr:glycosyltransferase family 1 protein [Burkholderia multivorans]MBU9326550.1 glycosyltransferase family 4 protein [Burkholderia multivorans]PRF06738.1 glycosyltransferase family 1 protein [Burkholderia multivorans]PRF85179.1 glycosyltransferase family 1 protein [Burkholderia multivorans]PRG65199.1 glycosyltransferase family 1 protein [Burkholderia multivorans]
MKVGFGTTALARSIAHGGVDGIGSYTREVGRALLARGDVDLVPAGFGTVVSDDVFPGARPPVNLGRHDIATMLGAVTPWSYVDERVLADEHVDIFHATDHIIPKLSATPVIATLMDAIPLSHPEWTTIKLAALRRWLLRRSGAWADHVITISEYSKREIVEHFGIAPERISVVPLGVHPRFFDPIDRSAREAVLTRLGLPAQFFLCVGTLQPRKNLERVVDAHASLPADLRRSVPLVVVGRAGWGCEELVARLRGHADGSIRWLEYLPDDDVRALMQSASALVFASLCEGFGLPVVEAFASGLPVVASNTTSVPEVAGDAAILVDPTSTGEIADGMRMIVETPGKADALRQAGLARARALNWPACAEQTLAVYDAVLRGTRRS